MATFTITVNGAPATVEADADTPLLWALRDLLGLRGTKFGCGIGACGACTVLLDGAAARSCQTPVSSVHAAAVSTIEGLDSPLQQQWVDSAVSQCGYCQAGQLMTAAALLRVNPHPTDADIDAAFAGMLCRCGTYQRIRAAVHAVAGGAA